MSLRFVLPVLTALAAFIPAAAQAQEYPWCMTSDITESTNCGFASYQQCMAAARGLGGMCTQNPAYPDRTWPQRRKRRAY